MERETGGESEPWYRPTARASAALRSAEAIGERELDRLPWSGVLRLTVTRDRDLAGGLLAGGIAFRLFLWLLPAALLAASVIGFQTAARGVQPGKVVAEVDLQSTFTTTVAAAAGQSGRSSLALGLFGAVLALYTATSLVRSLRIAHAIAWGLPLHHRPHGVRDGAIACVALLVLLGSAGGLRELRAEDVPLWLAGLILTGLTYAVAWLGMSLLLPRAEGTGWRDLLPGAVIVAVGVHAIHVFVVLWLADKLERSAHLYGVFGAAATVLFWLFLVARLMVVSGFLNASLHARRQAADGRADDPARVAG